MSTEKKLKRTSEDALEYLATYSSRLNKKIKSLHFDVKAFEKDLPNFENVKNILCETIAKSVKDEENQGVQQLLKNDTDIFCKYLLWGVLQQLAAPIVNPFSVSGDPKFFALPGYVKATLTNIEETQVLYEMKTKFIMIGRSNMEGTVSIGDLIEKSETDTDDKEHATNSDNKHDSENTQKKRKEFKSISKQHFAIMFDEEFTQEFLLINYSKNGTRVNGILVRDQPITLSDGAMIEIGAEKVKPKDSSEEAVDVEEVVRFKFKVIEQ